jgi:ATP-dependent DNA helicase RecG
MLSLIHLVGEQLIRRRFNNQLELNSAVYASLINYLINVGKIVTIPFDATTSPDVNISDISEEKLNWFLNRAKSVRNFKLPKDVPVFDILTHLNLIKKTKPNNAAILLFGNKPQRFFISSEVKCMHFHGVNKIKPIPSYQIYKGTKKSINSRPFIFNKVYILLLIVS